MAIQSPFFGKRDIENNTTGFRPPLPGARAPGPQAGTGHAGAVATNDTHAASVAPVAASTPVAAPPPVAAAPREGGSKLTVGPNIKLKGVEITDCDTLVVEGTVEATMDSRLMQITECGAFKGSAEIDIAEIHGAFDGNLTVRERLVIHATGKVTGTVRYGKLVIEEGGQLSGDIMVGSAQAAGRQRILPLAKADLQPA